MDDTTIEKKLELVQQIRSQYNRNQSDLSNREQILYGRTSGKASGNIYSTHRTYYHQEEANTDTYHMEEGSVSESLKLRSVLAAMLFMGALFFDLLGVKPVGLEMQQVFEMIAADYQENMTDFVNTMTEENILEP